jgi:hypothetical protein
VNLTRWRSRQQDGVLCYNGTKSKPRKDALAKIAVPFAIFPVTFAPPPAGLVSGATFSNQERRREHKRSDPGERKAPGNSWIAASP